LLEIQIVKIASLWPAAGLAVALLVACSDSHSHDTDAGHDSQYPTCRIIMDACHELDTGDPGPIHDCHDVAHDAKSDDPCVAKKDECLRTCAASADGGASTSDAGDATSDAHDHDHDH